MPDMADVLKRYADRYGTAEADRERERLRLAPARLWLLASALASAAVMDEYRKARVVQTPKTEGSKEGYCQS